MNRNKFTSETTTSLVETSTYRGLDPVPGVGESRRKSRRGESRHPRIEFRIQNLHGVEIAKVGRPKRFKVAEALGLFYEIQGW